MTDHVHERIGFREIDEDGQAVRAVSPNVPEPEQLRKRLAVNPFILALWVLDLAVAGFTVRAFSSVLAAFEPAVAGPTAQYNFIILSAAPYAALGAVLLTAALLFWHATSWQKKRPTRSE